MEELKGAVHGSFAAGLNAYAEKLNALQRTNELHFSALIKELEAFRAEMRSEFAALRTNSQVEVLRQVTPISEQVAAFEARTK